MPRTKAPPKKKGAAGKAPPKRKPKPRKQLAMMSARSPAPMPFKQAKKKQLAMMSARYPDPSLSVKEKARSEAIQSVEQFAKCLLKGKGMRPCAETAVKDTFKRSVAKYL